MTIAALLAALALGAPAQAIERKLLVGSFRDVLVEGDMTVNIVTSGTLSVRANGDRRLIDALKLERVGTTLHVSLAGMANNNQNRPITEPLVVNITAPELRNLTLKGNARLNVDDIKEIGQAKILLNGNGAIKVGRVRADSLSVALSGNGKIDLVGGTVMSTRLDIYGSGVYEGVGLVSRTVDLRQIGNAMTNTAASQSATISNDGAGTISVGGKADCIIRKAGSAQINCIKVKKAG